jgi:DNA-binding transcriptional LysR family regulator
LRCACGTQIGRADKAARSASGSGVESNAPIARCKATPSSACGTRHRYSISTSSRSIGTNQAPARNRLPLTRKHFQLRTDDQVAYVQFVASGAGIGFIAHYVARQCPGMRRVLPELTIPSLPCWLAVHREIRSSRVVRRVYDFLGQAVPPMLEAEV